MWHECVYYDNLILNLGSGKVVIRYKIIDDVNILNEFRGSG
jgi:hypothetical protein